MARVMEESWMGSSWRQETPVAHATEHWKDLDMVVQWAAFEFNMDFRVFHIDCWTREGEPELHEKGSRTWPCPVKTTDEAQVFCKGWIKWDGCTDLSFTENVELESLHFCGRKAAGRIGEMFSRLYDRAQENVPKYDVDIAS